VINSIEQSDNVIFCIRQMAPKQITVIEAARNFSEMVSRVRYQGGTTILVKGGKPMVKLSPACRPKTGRELAALWPKRPILSRELPARHHRFPQASRPPGFEAGVILDTCVLIAAERQR
jgi:antitoxin (DNA-binding transcriptional repressor) of toxin-antitoxin stability system